MGNCVSCRGCACARMPRVKGEDDFVAGSIKSIPREALPLDSERVKDVAQDKPPPVPITETQTVEAEVSTETEEVEEELDAASEHDSEVVAIMETSPYEASVTKATIQETMIQDELKEAWDAVVDDVKKLEDYVMSVSLETPLKQGDVPSPFAVYDEGPLEEDTDIPMDGIEEGRDNNNGIDYSFTLTRKAYYARYECRVDRKLLEGDPKHLFTKWFEIYGFDWCLCLKRTEDGHLAVYLYAGDDQEAADVHYWMTVVNRLSSKDICGGATDTFEPGSNRGQPQFAPVSRLMDPHSGFLVCNSITVRLDMRIKLPENEEQIIAHENNKASIKWRLRDIWEMSPCILRSDPFEIGNTKWQLRLHPYGTRYQKDTVSVFLDNRSATHAKAKFVLQTPNHRSIKKSMSKGLEKAFHPGEGWGYQEYLPVEALKDERIGYQSDGWFIIQGDIILESFGHRTNRRTTSTPCRFSYREDTPCILCSSTSLTSAFATGDRIKDNICKSCALQLKTLRHSSSSVVS